MLTSFHCDSLHYNDHDEGEECYRLQKKLILSASAGDVNGMREALENGANVEAGYGSSYRPLYVAAMAGHADAVSFLLDNGADPNWNEQFGFTALKIATYYNRKDAIKALIKRGADTCKAHKNDSGEMIRALDIARNNSSNAVEDMLIDAGARNCPGAFFK